MSEKNPTDPVSSEEHRDEAELVGRVIQSEQKLSDYFTTIITRSVTEQLDARNMIRLKITGMVCVVLMSVAIPGTLSWVQRTIVEQTSNALNVEFEQATATLESRFQSFLEKERKYSSFTNYLLYLSDRSTVPQSEMVSVALRLDELAKDPGIVERSEFPYLLDLVTRLAVKHGDTATLDLLQTDLAPLLTSPRTKPRLARYYGTRVLGDRFTSEAKRQAAAQRFQRYVDESESTPDFEMLLPLQLMVDDSLNTDGDDDVFATVKMHVGDLGPQDQASFIAETVRYSNPQFWEAPTTARTRRIAGLAGQTVIAHRDFYISLLDNVAVQTALINIAEAEANKGNTSFSAALSGFRNAFSGELASTDDEAFRQAINELVRAEVVTWLDDEILIEALRAQNRETGGYTEDTIQELEAQWQREFDSGAFDLIEGVMERPVSRHLRRLKRNSFGMYREVYIMDGVGLLVGSSDPNDDYWQGEEPKWLETYHSGGDLHVGVLEFDESALSWVVQISLPVRDPQTGMAIGAITIAVNPSLLERSI